MIFQPPKSHHAAGRPAAHLRVLALVVAAVIGVVVSALGPVPSPVAAQDSGAQEQAGAEERPVSWGIAPASPTGRSTRSVIEAVVEPGQTITDHVVVDNFSNEPLALDLYAADARPAEGEFDVNADDETSVGVGAWTDLEVEQVVVPARGEVFVEVRIQIPADATPGDHAGGILASRRSDASGEDVGIETERRVGTRVYLRVAGPVRPVLSVDALDGAYDHQWNPIGRDGLGLRFRVRNDGNVRLAGRTEITVTGPLGFGRRTVAGPEIGELLPGHSVQLDAQVPDVAPLGRLRVEVAVVPTTSADQVLADSIEPGIATAQVAAWPLGAAAAAVTLIALLVFRLVRRRRRRRRTREAALPADGEG